MNTDYYDPFRKDNKKQKVKCPNHECINGKIIQGGKKLCSLCDGVGREPSSIIGGYMPMCRVCQGNGLVHRGPENCYTCDGYGYVYV